LKVRIEEREYEGSGAEIMGQLRLAHPEADKFSAESYIRYVAANFTRSTGLEIALPESSLEAMADAMLHRLANAGAALIINDN
jgi:hypothetical protein